MLFLSYFSFLIFFVVKRMNRQWEFSVTAKTLPGEVLAVVGSCPELGNWNHEAAFFPFPHYKTGRRYGVGQCVFHWKRKSTIDTWSAS